MDNASYMKHAFETMVENYDEEDEDEELEAESIKMDTLQQWTPHSLKFELVVLPIKYSWLSMMGMTS